MTKKEVDALVPGIYVLHWKDKHGGGLSVAAVGRDEDGKRWYAPSNWCGGVPCSDWRPVLTVELVTTQEHEQEKRT